MNIQIIKTNPIDNNIESTKQFGLFLNEVLSAIKMMHWYTNNYNAHKVLGKNYETLAGLFDKIQEEIIGTCKDSSVLFPMINSNNSFNNLDHSNVLDSYKTISTEIKNNLNSLDLQNYLSAVSSGISNTKEEIITELNKTNYLISLINF
jgi:DNA-binding ferritin-like protein